MIADDDWPCLPWGLSAVSFVQRTFLRIRRNLIAGSDEWLISWFRLLAAISLDLCLNLTPTFLEQPQYAVMPSQCTFKSVSVGKWRRVWHFPFNNELNYDSSYISFMVQIITLFKKIRQQKQQRWWGNFTNRHGREQKWLLNTVQWLYKQVMTHS